MSAPRASDILILTKATPPRQSQRIKALSKKFNSNRHNVARKVVRLRTKELMSWARIAEEIGSSPRTARKLFQEQRGTHQHHDHIPSKGGRFPSEWFTDAEVPVVVGGKTNDWFKVTADQFSESTD